MHVLAQASDIIDAVDRWGLENSSIVGLIITLIVMSFFVLRPLIGLFKEQQKEKDEFRKELSDERKKSAEDRAMAAAERESFRDAMAETRHQLSLAQDINIKANEALDRALDYLPAIQMNQTRSYELLNSITAGVEKIATREEAERRTQSAVNSVKTSINEILTPAVERINSLTTAVAELKTQFGNFSNVRPIVETMQADLKEIKRALTEVQTDELPVVKDEDSNA